MDCYSLRSFTHNTTGNGEKKGDSPHTLLSRLPAHGEYSAHAISLTSTALLTAATATGEGHDGISVGLSHISLHKKVQGKKSKMVYWPSLGINVIIGII